MEVHAHTHTARKKWTHYFWEFLMLFLAVFCGFLAEYQLEHKIEKDREKQFIRSLAFDIKADTARINQIIARRSIREASLDSITLLLNSKEAAEHSADLYFHALTATRSISFRFLPNDGTMQQLKNSGALRLIRNRVIADSIAKYDVSVRSTVRQGELEETLINDYRSAAPQIFNALVFDQMLDEDNNPYRITGERPLLLSFDKKELDTYNYRLYSMKGLNKAIRRDIKLLLRQAENLLSLLNEKYHLSADRRTPLDK
jgi:hypothetical protein